MVKKNINDINLTTYDDLFGTTSEDLQQVSSDGIIEIPIHEIEDFPNHPFKVRIDEDMAKMIESIQERGVLMPTMVRPNPNGEGYQMIAGHRRKFASEISELTTIPAIVKDYNDDEATIIMVDSNIQRENLFPSERAYAYKMKYDALTNQGKRVDLTSSQLGTKYKSKRADQTLAEQLGTSRNQIQRYIRLTNLSIDLLDMVDNKQISINPAVELSYLTMEHQEVLYNVIQQEEATPSLSQSQKLKELSQMGKFNEDVAFSILTEEKPNQKEKLVINNDRLKKYFPKEYTPKQKEELVITLVKKWAKQQKRNQER